MLMPNYIGAKSIHASMRKCITQKKVGLIEAYVIDQNYVVGQIVAYTTYIEGCNRGKGPTIFEMAFQNADIIGSPQAFLNASNMVLSQSMKYGFHSSDALHGNLKTTSVKEIPYNGICRCKILIGMTKFL